MAVGERQHADLRALEVLLDDDAAAGFAEHALHHGGDHGALGVLPGKADHHALAQRQAVGLDHHRKRRGLHILQRGLGVVEHLVGRGGDVILLHQVLGEHLAGLDAGGPGVRPEARDAQRVQPVHAPQRQRVVRGHHGEVSRVGLRVFDDALDIRGPDVHAGRVLRDARVAGQRHDFGDLRVLPELFDDGVLAPAAADDQYPHDRVSFIRINRARGPVVGCM